MNFTESGWIIISKDREWVVWDLYDRYTIARITDAKSDVEIFETREKAVEVLREHDILLDFHDEFPYRAPHPRRAVHVDKKYLEIAECKVTTQITTEN